MGHTLTQADNTAHPASQVLHPQCEVHGSCRQQRGFDGDKLIHLQARLTDVACKGERVKGCIGHLEKKGRAKNTLIHTVCGVWLTQCTNMALKYTHLSTIGSRLHVIGSIHRIHVHLGLPPLSVVLSALHGI